MKAEALVLIPESEKTKIKYTVMPLVLCRECKHRGKNTCSAGAGIAYPPPDNWFCADGERSE